MKKRKTKIQFTDKNNKIGDVWLERLLERAILEKLNIPIELQGAILSQKHKKQGEMDYE
ncbi:hypothetical protein [Bacillus sp. HMF5848]|uniref:hypothetical protein n=1 Tax=Bacillus sp. HMF5848 TaxID=2495421 RepID=UPI00163B4C3F|nr:hypothetical protein [Bacillus sp. HMF5848]